MTTAIHYTSVRAPGQEIYGLQVAVENWLKAWFRYGKQDQFQFLIGDSKEWDEIQELARNTELDVKRLVGLDRRYVKENFASLNTIVRLNPDSKKLLWQRQLTPNGFNFCGLAHAISGIEAGEILEQYCLAPSTNTDAIICPSHAVQSAIRTFWDLYSDYIQQQFGTGYDCPVQLPVIPLGIDTEKFEKITTQKHRNEQRKQLGLCEEDILLLWVGRLSHAIKAHPLAMFQAAEHAAELTNANIHLVMVGYFVPSEAEGQFKKLAEDFCKKTKISFIAHDDKRFPDGLWAGGDIFLSLIDNMQESFGLTPIEAMAAGLPRVISDWDGYRDSVTHGEDGFLIPTLQPPPDQGRDLSSLLLTGREVYGGFLAKSALSVAVDQHTATEALTLLIKDKSKRQMMARKAREHVRSTYDWKYIIPAYELLWQEMAERRQKEISTFRKWPSALPQVPDPFTMYASYPSATLKEHDKVSVIASTEMIKKLWRHEINIFALDVMVEAEDTTKLINYISSQGAISIGEVIRQFPTFDQGSLWRTLCWLIKLGILKTC